MIGTLNEGSLHAQLKEWYRKPGDLVEHSVDGYLIDLVRADLLIEVQTGGFAPLKKKLDDLASRHRVRLVVPIAERRRIIRLDDTGREVSARLSPKRGKVENIFGRLVSFPHLLARDTFELEVLLTGEDEVRVHRPGQARRRKGWVIAGRSLAEVFTTVPVTCPADLVEFLPPSLPELFTTSAMAEQAGISRRLAQQMAYCLRRLGELESVDKQGNSVVYRRSA